MNATELFEKLVESGVRFNFQFSRLHDTTYFQVYVSGTEDNGEDCKSINGSRRGLADAYVFLGRISAELYPESEFAKWWRERT